MKKISRQIILVLLISFLIATTQNSFAANGKDREITKIDGVVSDYNIVRTSCDKNSKKIGIFFPQINGLQDKTKQNKINKIIKDTALVDPWGDLVTQNTSYDCYALDYTIMWSSNKLLSIKFSGYSVDKTAPHPNRNYRTVNIDLNTGNRIVLPDFINADHDFIKSFINKAQFLEAPLDIPADVISEFKREKFNIDNLRYEFDKTAQFYFTSTGVVFSISTHHAIGDYALFTSKHSDLLKYIKQNKAWNDIKSDFPSMDYQIIRDQCFKTNLAAFGDAWFVSGFSSSLNGVKKGLRFYLIDQNANVKYTFPNLFSNNLGYWGINAITFRDVNHDGKNDIIVIASVNVKDVDKEVDEVGVYLYSNNRFILDDQLNAYLNTEPKSQ